MNLTCPQCRIVNAPDAKFCKGCGVAFAVTPVKTNTNSIKPLFWMLGLLGLALLIGGVGSVTENKRNTASTYGETGKSEESQTAYKSPPLKLLSSKDINSSEMYFRVIGEVQNVSSEKIDNLQAVVTAYDKSGGLVGTESAGVNYSPVMPNQTTPFTVVMRQNPEIETYRINFREGFSGTIDFTDARPSKNPPKPKKAK